MRKNYNIKINPRQLSSEEIDRFKDFDTLLQVFESTQQPKVKSLSKRFIYRAVAVAAVLAGFLFYWSALHPRFTPAALTTAEYFAQQDLVNPPIEKLDVVYSSQKINGKKGGTITFSSGSRLIIPEEAFLDDRGNLIEDDVDIQFREMHDFIDFFLAGIPMTYDSAGITYHLESAGMMEIYALQNGRRLQMAPDKQIEVELVSVIAVHDLDITPEYFIYKLDTVSRNWQFQDIDRIEVIEQIVSEKEGQLGEMKTNLLEQLYSIDRQTEAELQSLENSLPPLAAPLPPQKKEDGAQTLELDFLDKSQLEKEAAELYEGTIWQISPQSPAFDERAFNVVWEDAQLSKINNRDYELTLIHGNNRVRLTLNPVLIGSDYERAVQEYETAFAEYQKKLAAREQQLQSQKEQIHQNAENARATARQSYKEQMASLGDPSLTDAGILLRIINRFSANSFGIWNCDRPIPPDSQEEIDGEFTDQDGNRYQRHVIYLVNQQKNTLYRFYSAKGNPMRFDPDSNNLLWVVTRDNTIAVFRPEEFKKIDRNEEEYVFVMERIDKAIRSEKDLREILQTRPHVADLNMQ